MVYLPEGWTEGYMGGIASCNDPVRGGIVDYRIADGKWFVIPMNDDIMMVEDLDSREEAFAYLEAELKRIGE